MRIVPTFERTAFNHSGGGLADSFRNPRLEDTRAEEEALFNSLLMYDAADTATLDDDSLYQQQESASLAMDGVVLDAELAGFFAMSIEPCMWPYAPKRGVERVYRVI